MDKRSVRWKSACLVKKNNAFTVEFERTDDLTIFIIIDYQTLIY